MVTLFQFRVFLPSLTRPRDIFWISPVTGTAFALMALVEGPSFMRMKASARDRSLCVVIVFAWFQDLTGSINYAKLQLLTCYVDS